MDYLTQTSFPKAVLKYMKDRVADGTVTGHYIHYSKSIDNAVPVRVYNENGDGDPIIEYWCVYRDDEFNMHHKIIGDGNFNI